MEIATHDDAWANYLRYQHELAPLPEWARDLLVEYGLPRQMFFCPSQPEAPTPVGATPA